MTKTKWLLVVVFVAASFPLAFGQGVDEAPPTNQQVTQSQCANYGSVVHTVEVITALNGIGCLAGVVPACGIAAGGAILTAVFDIENPCDGAGLDGGRHNPDEQEEEDFFDSPDGMND